MTLTNSPDGISRVVGAFLLGFQWVCIISSDPAKSQLMIISYPVFLSRPQQKRRTAFVSLGKWNTIHSPSLQGLWWCWSVSQLSPGNRQEAHVGVIEIFQLAK